ncbi:TPA: ATP-binding protein [Streptococcus agalactiae]
MVKKLEYPIDRIHQNLALRKDKVVVAYYRIPNTPITITDSDKKDSHKAKVAQVIKKLAKYKNFDISLIPKDYLLGEKMSDFEADLADDVKELGLETLDFTVDTLTHEMEIPYQFDWLIGVDLGKGQYNANIKEFIYNQFESIASNFASLAGYEVEVDEDWYKEHSEEELLVYSLLSTLKAKRLTDVDLFYYQRMQFLRYVPHTKSEVIANRNMLNVTDTLIKSLEGGFLKLESAYGSSFVSVLPVGRFSTIFNGFHLGELVQRMSFPVELRFQAEFIDKTKLGGTMGRSNTRYDQIMKEAYNTNTVQQDDILMGAYSLKDLMKKVGNKEEIIEYGCYLVVAGSSLNQLKQRRYAILSYFDDMKVNVYEASHDTPYLFQALLYGQDLQKTTRKWNHLVTARGFSELMLFTNTQSGNRIGWYIGRVDNRLTAWDSIDEAIMGSKNLVLFNATVANKEDVAGKVTKNPHVIITGATGQGKSYLAQMIFLHTAQQNVRVLYIDPKRELRQHYLKVVSDPEYARKFPLRKKQIEETNFVTLDSSVKENHGVLDPIVILDKDILNYTDNLGDKATEGEEKNRWLSAVNDYLWIKSGYVILKIFEAVILAVPLILIQLIAFMADVLVIILMFIFPLALLVSFLPRMQDIIFNVLKVMFGAVSFPALAGFLTLIIFYTQTLIATFVKKKFTDGSLLSGSNFKGQAILFMLLITVFVQGCVFWGIWKYKETFLRLIIGSRASQVINQSADRINEKANDLGITPKSIYERAHDMSSLAMMGAGYGVGTMMNAQDNWNAFKERQQANLDDGQSKTNDADKYDEANADDTVISKEAELTNEGEYQSELPKEASKRIEQLGKESSYELSFISEGNSTEEILKNVKSDNHTFQEGDGDTSLTNQDMITNDIENHSNNYTSPLKQRKLNKLEGELSQFNSDVSMTKNHGKNAFEKGFNASKTKEVRKQHNLERQSKVLEELEKLREGK